MKPSDNTPSFRDLGKHMLLAWDEGIHSLQIKSHYSFSQHQNKNLLGGISNHPKPANPKGWEGAAPILKNRNPL